MESISGARYDLPMASPAPTVGTQLREWRQRRHLSQLDLAVEAEISTKHLSFLETGRSQPSREMVLHLAELLDVPLRERNTMLVSAGFAPVFPERPLDDPALQVARRAIDLVLRGHEPFPAVAVDRHWALVAANRPAMSLMGGADPALMQPPINVLRLTLHPSGLAGRILNYTEWRLHVLARLRRQIAATADPILGELAAELESYPVPGSDGRAPRADAAEFAGVVVPMRFQSEIGVLSLFSTITIFGTPVDITLSELGIEAFYPADTATAELLRRIVSQA
jgi:transcriptional regulator with XRE-family HTH domain